MGHASRTNPKVAMIGERRASGLVTPGGAPVLPAIVRDAINRPLKEGDRVVVSVQGPHLFEITAITPVVDPNVPPEQADAMLNVTFRAVLRFFAVKNAINPEFLRIGQAEEFARSITQPESSVKIKTGAEETPTPTPPTTAPPTDSEQIGQPAAEEIGEGPRPLDDLGDDDDTVEEP